MKKGRNWVWIFGIISVLYFLETPLIYGEDLRDLLPKFHPYITVQEEYSNNINLTSTNKKDEFITTVNAGLKFSTLSAENNGIDLDYNLGFIFYAKEHDKNDNYISMAGSLNAWYTMAQGLTFRVRDYLTRSDEPRERDYSATALQGQYLLSTTRQREIYFRNVFEPSLEYQFGKENLLGLKYRNNIYWNQSSSFQDSQENYINPKITYWFDIRNGVSLEYGLTLGDFQHSPDLLGQAATGRYTYRFNTRTSIFGEYTYTRRDFESPSTDYDVHAPGIGLQHAFTPTLSGSSQVGYYWQIPELGSKQKGVNCKISLTQRAERTTYTVSFQGGYIEDYFTAENLGFSKYYGLFGTINHQVLEKVMLGLWSSFEWAKPGNEKDRIWNLGVSGSYQILKWLSPSLSFSHRENHSNIGSEDYSEYRGIFRMTASF